MLTQVVDEGALVTNLGGLIEALQAGKEPDITVIGPINVNKVNSRLPNELLENVKLFKLVMLIKGRWKTIAMIYEKWMAELIGAALFDFTGISIKLLSHPDNRHELSFTRERSQFIKWSANVKRVNSLLEYHEERRKKAFQNVPTPTKQFGRKQAVPLIPTGKSGRLLKQDYITAILKMNPEANVDKDLIRLKALYTREYNKCPVAPPKKVPKKKAPKRGLTETQIKIRRLVAPPKKVPTKRAQLRPLRL